MKIFESAPDGILISDFGNRGVIDINQRFEQISGYGRGEILGRTMTDIGLLMDPFFWHRLMSRLRREGALRNLEYQMRRKTGEIATISWSAEAIEIDSRPCFVSVHRDVTAERIAAESLLLRRQHVDHLVTIGQLCGRVAHDFNRLLTAVFGSAKVPDDQLHAHDAARRDLENIRRAALRAHALARQLVMFTRHNATSPVVLEPNEMLARLSRIFRLAVAPGIELVMDTHRDVGWVNADADQIEQLVINLVVNARDAMPDGGVLTITSDAVDVDAAFARDHPGAVPGAFVRLRVSDTGSGISAADQERIFAPWFTTKDPSDGSGLGLAVVRAIATQAGGYVLVESAPGHGATFSVYLPRLAATCQPHEHRGGPACSPGSPLLEMKSVESGPSPICPRL